MNEVKIMLDTSCLNRRKKLPTINELEKLEKQGIVKLSFHSYVEQENLKHYNPKFREAWLRKSIEHPSPYFFPSDSDFETNENVFDLEIERKIIDILFPNRKLDKKLTDNDWIDIFALIEFARSGYDFFITLDLGDFIKENKKDELEKIGIKVREISRDKLDQNLLDEINELYRKKQGK
jgi:hypothetical protein